MEAFLPAVAMVALLWKLVDVLKACTNWKAGGKNTVVTQLIVWVGGVVVVFLFAQTDWAGSIQIGDAHLGALNIWSQLAVGLSLGSVTSVAFDAKKAVDPSDSARTPELLPPSSGLPQVPDEVL